MSTHTLALIGTPSEHPSPGHGGLQYRVYWELTLNGIPLAKHTCYYTWSTWESDPKTGVKWAPPELLSLYNRLQEALDAENAG